MKNLKLFLSVVFVVLLFNSCESDDGLFRGNSSFANDSLSSDIKNLGPDNDTEINVINEAIDVNPTLVFGRYYGRCQGNDCIEVFKLIKGRLLEDTADRYPTSETFYKGDFKSFKGSNKVELNDISSNFPLELLDSKLTTYGTPDAGGWGGIYLEYQNGIEHRYWLLDLKTENIPKSLRAYVAIIDRKVTEIGEINNLN